MNRKIQVIALCLLIAAISIIGSLWWLASPAGKPAGLAAVSAQAAASTYVDNQQCLACHADQARQWQQSHHAMAMALPTVQSVRGNFNNTSFTHQGLTSRFFIRDGQYFVNTEGPDGKRADFAVSHTFGVAPLQQYLIAQPGGRLQALQIAWDTERARWFQLLADERTPPGDVLHWTGRYQTANTMCLSCHTTGFEKNYNAGTDTFASRWTEPNVSCQSCHGAGSAHVAWAQAKQSGTSLANGPANFGLVVDTAKLAGNEQVDVCSSCHSRRTELTASPMPGERRLDNYRPVLLSEGLYHVDGQQLDEVFVDGSFRQSRMFTMGVTCTHCHNPHTGKLKLEGNAVCTQCHSTPGNSAFPSAARAYDSPAHHFHKADSAGAQCASCHMPAKNYMRVQARPEHAIRIPRPDLSEKLGTPNACNQCHDNKSAQWAAHQIAQWYGPNRRQETHYGEVLAQARSGDARSGAALSQLAADKQQAAIVRATALDALRFDATTHMEVRIEATRDADPLVRAAAASSFESAPTNQRLYALVPLLKDPARVVRIAAAHTLSFIPREQLPASAQTDFDAVVAEYIAAQETSLDMPGARLNLAVIYQNTGKPALAEEHYLAALRIDPDFTPARANLAKLYNAQQRNAEAARVLRDALKRNPGIGELQYSLGLLLAEDKQLVAATEALAKAAKLLPQRARVHYNLGLALQKLGQRKAAEAALLKAQSVDPGDPQFMYAMVVFYAQAQQREQAMKWIDLLKQQAPGNPEARKLLNSLQAGG